MKSRVRIDSIKKDPATQPRELINWVVVQDYADQMKDGKQFEPVTLFVDGIETWLADGYHRVYAAQKAGLVEILADLRNGTKEDAIWFAASANAKHGLPRSNADKRRAVLAALRCHRSADMSDRAIADHCGLTDHKLVGDVRAEQLGESPSSQPKRTKGKDGKWRKRPPARSINKAKSTLAIRAEERAEKRSSAGVIDIESRRPVIDSKQYQAALRACKALTVGEKRQLINELLSELGEQRIA